MINLGLFFYTVTFKEEDTTGRVLNFSHRYLFCKRNERNILNRRDSTFYFENWDRESDEYKNKG